MSGFPFFFKLNEKIFKFYSDLQLMVSYNPIVTPFQSVNLMLALPFPSPHW